MRIIRAAHAFVILLLLSSTAVAVDSYQFGFSKLDITPDKPMRLSGYGDRAAPSEGVEQKLWLRTMVLRSPRGELAALVSADTIGVSGAMTTSIARRLESEHGIPRERFVLCSTHAHTAPQLAGVLTNLLATPLSDAETAAMNEYTERLADTIVESVKQAIENLAAGRMWLSYGKATFAVNRRVLRDGQWTGFGVNKEGAVDHRLPVLKITDAGGKLRGVIFNYACHCTTLTSAFNRVSGDWAGYAAADIEEQNPGVVAVCTIGCGADANPEPRGELAMAQAHGREASLAVKDVLSGSMKEIGGDLSASFGYAGLPVDRPSLQEVRANTENKSPQVRKHAENMLETFRRMGRLPESYPMPIQAWKFGDDLTMVFLGGEVVVDYAHRLQRELAGDLWVTAYANDVFGYVASERMRREGGYEVDFSMIFYNQPGRWSEGTEEVIIRRVHEILESRQAERPVPPSEAVGTFRLAEGFEIELVAAEPLIADPVSFAFGPDGRLWVVEMGDYPRGADEKGTPGGRVRFLEDEDRDGVFDKSTLFAEGLNFPNGIMAWRNGVLVSAAPDILFLEDTDGDGEADVRKSLFTGFTEANPQHRVNGFAYGLDNWVHLASGDSRGKIKSTLTGEELEVSGRDVRIRPDEGAMGLENGRSQYGRMRNDWGDWFGSSNNNPIFQYVISDRYLRRNRFVAAPSTRVDLILPSPAPPVFPASRTVDRFNDLYDANRFTSGCGPAFFRDVSLGDEMADSALVCEPVHNLVHRTLVEREGVVLRGKRAKGEEQSEFLASTDVWSRPVKVETGPDGAIWVADMYRYVIEHPQWIPEEWQRRLDLRAGADMGRIYRVYRKGHRPGALPRLADKSPRELVSFLESTNGTIRDTAQQLLVQSGDQSVVPELERLAVESELPVARLHALGTLLGLGALEAKHVEAALGSEDWRVQRFALRLAEPMLDENPRLGEILSGLVDHPEMALRFQLALTLGEWKDPQAGVLLGRLGVKDRHDRWMRAAVLSSAADHAEEILAAVLAAASAGADAEWADLVESLIATALGSDAVAAAPRVLSAITAEQAGGVQTWQMGAVAAFLVAAERRDVDLTAEALKENAEFANAWSRAELIHEAARAIAENADEPVAKRQAAVRLLARGLGDPAADRGVLAALLNAQTPPVLQSTAIATLAELQSADVAGLLLENWRGHSPGLREQILAVLMSRRDWTAALLDALEEGTVSSADLDAATRSRLLSSRADDVRTRAQQLLSALVSADREQVLAEYAAAVGMKGNLIRGAALFTRRCATCHRFRGRGNEIGPNLAGLQDKSPRNLLVSVLDPNRAVERAYLEYVVATADGKTVNGMIVGESSNSFTMAQANGQKVDILRGDVEAISGTGKSLMPEGLEKDFSVEDLADIFAFLQSSPLPAGQGDGVAGRALLADAGLSGQMQVISHPALRTMSTWLGELDIPYVAAGKGSQALMWRADPLPKAATSTGSAHYRFPVAFGKTDDAKALTNGEAAGFELTANGGEALAIPPLAGDASQAGRDGRIVWRYLVMEQGGDFTSGVLDIEIAGGTAAEGKPVEFSVTPVGGASDTIWFGVLPVE